jgi:hypothetical protein
MDGLTMIVRFTLGGGRSTTTSVPAVVADEVGNVDIFAFCLLEAIPGAVLIEVWTDGRSPGKDKPDPPDAVARPPKAENAPEIDDVVLVAAAVLMLAGLSETHDPPDGALPRLTVDPFPSLPGPQALWGRAEGPFLPPL